MSSTAGMLKEAIASMRVISTHCHHREDAFFHEGYDLTRMLSMSYASWCGVKLTHDPATRAPFFDAIRFRSYFKWIERALQSLYQIDAPLNAGTFDAFDRALKDAHAADRDRHLKLLEENCRYDAVVLDSYWAPGENNGHPALFTPTFRLDSFYFAYDRSARDHDNMNAIDVYGDRFHSLKDVTNALHELIAEKKQAGAVALKCAMAYSRGLDFAFVSETEASRVFEGARDAEAVKAYQDYVFHASCELAAHYGIPFQVHTGLGRLDKSNAYRLRDAIAAHTQTRFVLFHGGYPWTDDVLGLAHVFPGRVLPDLCWLPIISPDVAERMLGELLDVCDARALTWGCDAWTGEESVGALMAATEVVASALARKVDSGWFSVADAREICKGIFRTNASAIYGLR